MSGEQQAAEQSRLVTGDWTYGKMKVRQNLWNLEFQKVQLTILYSG